MLGPVPNNSPPNPSYRLAGRAHLQRAARAGAAAASQAEARQAGLTPQVRCDGLLPPPPPRAAAPAPRPRAPPQAVVEKRFKSKRPDDAPVTWFSTIYLRITGSGSTVWKKMARGQFEECEAPTEPLEEVLPVRQSFTQKSV